MISISGIVAPPSMLVVLSSQAGKELPVLTSTTAMAVAQSTGCAINPRRLPRPATSMIPSDICNAKITRNTVKPRASPVSPKANKHKGRPILPILGNNKEGKKVPTFNRIMRINVPPKASITKRMTKTAAEISAIFPISMPDLLKDETIRQGAPIFITRRVTKSTG